MAAGRHNLTRRALLGAGAAVCAIGAVPGRSALARAAIGAAPGRGALARDGLVAGGRARWDRALAAFRRAEARLAAFRRAEALLPAVARAWPACEALEERFNDLECARLAALRRLLRVPAPDLTALSLKIDLAVEDQAWELTGAEPCLAALKADGRRLAGGG